jgi:hypothetical protein
MSLSCGPKSNVPPNFPCRAAREAKSESWSWRRDLNPRPADYKSAALPTELRQPDETGILARTVPNWQRFAPFFAHFGLTAVRPSWCCLPDPAARRAPSINLAGPRPTFQSLTAHASSASPPVTPAISAGAAEPPRTGQSPSRPTHSGSKPHRPSESRPPDRRSL